MGICQSGNLLLAIPEPLRIKVLSMHKSPEQKIKDAVHRVASAFGLLGMMTALPTTAHFIEYEKVYLPKNQFIRQETMDTLTYIKLFFHSRCPISVSAASSPFGSCLLKTWQKLHW